MSKSDQFRQYADEALLWAAQSKTEEEKRLLFELCAHMDASGVRERPHWDRQWQSAISQSPVRDFDCCQRTLLITHKQ